MVRLFDFPSALRWVSTCGYMDEERCRGRDREGSERSRGREIAFSDCFFSDCFSLMLYIYTMYIAHTYTHTHTHTHIDVGINTHFYLGVFI
jgi:hypothetical protein